ncbi:MAG: PAS domain-containing protein [Flavobacteriaceae bacterium]|nr:PAS domain-containing protein [Flavobacteriaceae bacterium]
MKTLSFKKTDIHLTTKVEKTLRPYENIVNEELLLNKNTKSVCRVSTKNTIKFCNTDFIKISGFTEKELLNNSLDLIKHPEMPKIILDFITYHIKKGKTIQCILKNKTQDGKYFWTLSTFKPNESSNLTIAYAITSTEIPLKAKINITKLYNCLYKLETKIDETTAYRYLIGFLEEKCMSLTAYTKHLIALKS